MTGRGPLVVGCALLVTVLSGAALSGCGQIQDAAENRVDEAVDSATARAGEAVEGELSEQAQSVLDDTLEQVDTPCSDFTGLGETERSGAATVILQAFWLTQLYTEPPTAEVTAGYSAALVEQCTASGESRLADVARSVYDTGQFAPPQG